MADTPAIIKERLSHWAQYAGITVVVFLLVLGGVYVWRFVFKPKTTTSVGKVESGGIVNITNKNSTRFIIPFVEAGAEARDKEKIGAFVRVGVRIEF